MKKPYIRPESRLFAINFTESIAQASSEYTEETVDGLLHIGWTGNVGLYMNVPGAIVGQDPANRMNEYKGYFSQLDMVALLGCLW